MLSILITGGILLSVTLVDTPFFIRILVTRQYGQSIRQGGPTSHQIKRGTPTMGGVVIIVDALLGYFVANLTTGRPPNASGLLLLYLVIGLGFTDFLDDFAKIRKKQSLGLTSWAKILGQAFMGVGSTITALRFRDPENRTPATLRISILRDMNIDLAFLGVEVGIVSFVVWANFLITAWFNAVNLADGFGGLATGASMIAFGAYATITVWRSNQVCHGVSDQTPGCYDVRDPRDLTIVYAAIVGSCFGFLWWNASSAKIFMGDTGSLALRGVFAGISILIRIEILAVLVGGFYLIEVGSAALRMGFYKITRKRIFHMAPLHRHFELKGWKEVIMAVRSWITEVPLMLMTVDMFYAERLTRQ